MRASPLLLVLPLACFSLVVSGQDGPTARPPTPVPVRSFAAFLGEKIAMETLSERRQKLNDDAERLYAEARALRKLGERSDLRWDSSAKEGAWVLYELPAPVSSSSPAPVSHQAPPR